jgi:hypothetical protein
VSGELVKGAPAINSMDDLERVSALLAKSGYFKDAMSAAQAGVKVLAGLEFGISAFSAMSGIHIISGRPALGANLMAAKIKASGKYDYRVKEMTDEVCTIVFLERGNGVLSQAEEIGVSTFTIQDAKKAGTQNLQKFPRNMLFARAMSNGVRWFTPDIFLTPVYTPEELNVPVDGDGEVISVEAVDVTPVQAEKDVEPSKESPVKEAQTITPKRAEGLKAELQKLGIDTKNEAQIIEMAFGLTELEHFTDLTDGEAVILWQRLKKQVAAKQEEAKPVWQTWTSDDDATSWAAEVSKRPGEGFNSGAELMNAWQTMKETTPREELYERWHQRLTLQPA